MLVSFRVCFFVNFMGILWGRIREFLFEGKGVWRRCFLNVGFLNYFFFLKVWGFFVLRKGVVFCGIEWFFLKVGKLG